MVECDETFAFRAPKYLKHLCKALQINYGEECRKHLEQLCNVQHDENFPTRAYVPKEKWEEAKFKISFEIRQKQRELSLIEQLERLPPVLYNVQQKSAVQCTTNQQNSENVIQCTTNSAVQCTTTSEDLLRHLRVLVYQHLEDHEMAQAFTTLDSGEDPGDLIKEYWSLICERSNGGDSRALVKKVEQFEGDFEPYLSHILYDMGESRAEQECEQEEAEA